LAEAYIHTKLSKLKRGGEVESYVRRNLLQQWGSQPLDGISRRDVVQLVAEVAKDGDYAARHTFKAGRQIFRWGRNLSYLEHSPCEGGQVDEIIGSKAKARDRVLTDAELTAVWLATPELRPPWRQFMRLLMLLGSRRSELAKLRWSEVDLDNRRIEFPADRMK